MQLCGQLHSQVQLWIGARAWRGSGRGWHHPWVPCAYIQRPRWSGRGRLRFLFSLDSIRVWFFWEWLLALCARKACGNSSWRGVTVASVCGVPTLSAAIFVPSRICWATREWCRDTWPVPLRIERRRCANTGNPALWESPIRSRTPVDFTSAAETADPVPSSVGPIWKWPCARTLSPITTLWKTPPPPKKKKQKKQKKQNKTEKQWTLFNGPSRVTWWELVLHTYIPVFPNGINIKRNDCQPPASSMLFYTRILRARHVSKHCLDCLDIGRQFGGGFPSLRNNPWLEIRLGLIWVGSDLGPRPFVVHDRWPVLSAAGTRVLLFGHSTSIDLAPTTWCGRSVQVVANPNSFLASNNKIQQDELAAGRGKHYRMVSPSHGNWAMWWADTIHWELTHSGFCSTCQEFEWGGWVFYAWWMLAKKQTNKQKTWKNGVDWDQKSCSWTGLVITAVKLLDTTCTSSLDMFNSAEFRELTLTRDNAQNRAEFRDCCCVMSHWDSELINNYYY